MEVPVCNPWADQRLKASFGHTASLRLPELPPDSGAGRKRKRGRKRGREGRGKGN